MKNSYLICLLLLLLLFFVLFFFCTVDQSVLMTDVKKVLEVSRSVTPEFH